MADRLTIARPYARAAFEEARAEQRLAPWAEAMHVGAAVVSDARVQALLGNPHVTPNRTAILQRTGPGKHDFRPIYKFKPAPQLKPVAAGAAPTIAAVRRPDYQNESRSVVTASGVSSYRHRQHMLG